MRMDRYVMLALVPALMLVMGCASAAAAQDQDPPDRVGRVSFLVGDVSFRPAGMDEWAEATLNYPLTTGDDLWADVGARAEIGLGSAAIRLAPSTAFGLLALDDEITQVSLTQGSVQVRIRDLNGDQTFEIDTPNGAVSLLEPGSYRVDVDANGDATTVTVRDGQAELTAGGSSFSIDPGQAATVSGTDSPSYDVHDPLPPDAWESWAATRDRRHDMSLSAHYVSPDMPGYADLDDYGDWRDTPEYGPVWTPRRVTAGWAPYRNGHWAWVDPWGWTWIDDAPWGFAPYHYGRWAYMGNGWGWVPGHVVARPVYAPALVAFVGGSNFNISIGVGGGVGWFPLAPDEAYYPTYRVSDRYVHNVNIATINVTTVSLGAMTNFNYRNRSSPGGVTVVTRETFVGARPVGRSLIVVPRDRLNSAPVVGSAAPFAPTRTSVLNRPEGQARRAPPANAMTRRVVVRAAPPAPPVPFAERQRAMQARPGHPLDDATVNSLRGGAPSRENRFVRPAAEGSGQTLRPARGGLPVARPASPNTGGRRQPQADQPTPPQRGQPMERPAPPSRTDRGQRQNGAERPAPAMPTPPRLPAEQPAPPQQQDRGRRPNRPPAEQPAPAMPTPPRQPAEQPQPARPSAAPQQQDRGQRPGYGRPQPEPRPPAAQPPPEQPKAAEPPAQPSRQDRGQRPGNGRPQPEPRPPAAQPTPEQPKAAEPPAPPSRQDRGQRPNTGRPQPEPRPPAPAPPTPPRAAEPAEPPPAPPAPTPPPPQAAPAQPAAPPQRGRQSPPDRGGQDNSGNNQRQGRRGQDTSSNNPR